MVIGLCVLLLSLTSRSSNLRLLIGSNNDYQKLDLPKQVVMFLTWLRRKVTFQELGYQYGCGKEAVQ